MCISILHPPVDDPQSGELPSERWNPTQNVRYTSCFSVSTFTSFPNDKLKPSLRQHICLRASVFPPGPSILQCSDHMTQAWIQCNLFSVSWKLIWDPLSLVKTHVHLSMLSLDCLSVTLPPYNIRPYLPVYFSFVQSFSLIASFGFWTH